MTSSDQPAILGGQPLFEKAQHLVRPILPFLSDMMHGIADLYSSRMLTNQGVFVQRLERRIEKELGVKHCALFCNGTTAIMCLAKALGLKGDVLVPSFTFAATAQALQWIGLSPRFVDIDRETLTMDPDEIEAAITERTSAIFPVNVFGKFSEHDRIYGISKKNGLPLIYDSAQSFGTRYKGRAAGSLGDAEVLSFHATKVFHTFEGGAVVTNDKQLYERLCKVRNFGFEGYLNCVEPGINGKMCEFPALIGLCLIDQLPSQIIKRKSLSENYISILKDISGIHLPIENKDVEVNYAYFYVVIDSEKFGMSNIELYYALMAENIVTRCYFYPPVHRTAYYKRIFAGKLPDLPQTDWAATHVLCLPLHTEMEINDLATIKHGITRCQQNAEQIKETLKGKVPSDWDALVNSTFVDPHDLYILSKQKK